MLRVKNIIAFTLLCSLTACNPERTYLPDAVKSINPYKEGQSFTFVSSSGKVANLSIGKVEDLRFPQGLGQFQNERLVVSAFQDGEEFRILTLLAKDKSENQEKILFNIILNETFLQMKSISLDEFQNNSITNFSGKFKNYSDVLVFSNHTGGDDENEIIKFFWSQSTGFVRLEQRNGISWDLKE